MNILAFFAHPDDETMLAGGTLALLSQSGHQVHYLCATRGEGGETGEPAMCSPDVLGGVRHKEMECAVAELCGASLTFLDYIDPRVGSENSLYPYTEDLENLADQVDAHIHRVGAEAVLTHGSNGEYGHPAHIITHRAARLAVENMGSAAPSLYSVSASFPGHPKPRITNKDEPAHLIIDISPVMNIKTEAALCHRTQHALFVRRSSLAAGRQMTVPEVIINVESLHRSHPVLETSGEDQIFAILSPWEVQLTSRDTNVIS
ncbi:MAG: PIG-L deacetylase family protein [Chloroflexota bacterium]|nr:PIG-L deacetylase family protein [Chloroflexota bacterium]